MKAVAVIVAALAGLAFAVPTKEPTGCPATGTTPSPSTGSGKPGSGSGSSGSGSGTSTGSAPAGSSGAASALCNDVLFSVPQCCATDVLGVADLNCQNPSAVPSSPSNFQSLCAAVGQRAECCTLPVAGQALLCRTPIGVQ